MKMKFGILHKLILGFLIPVIFIIILGFISYSKSSEGLISNYKKATTNTITMATRYLEFSMDTVNNISLQYTKDSDTSYFTRGLIYTEAQERLNFVTTANNKLLAKADMEKFVANIHIIPGQDIPVLTSDMENMTGFYPELLEAEEGKKLKNAKTESYWMGEHPLIDSKFGLKAADYAFSFFRKFTGGSSAEGNACIVIDVSAQEVETFLQALDLGENSIVGLVTPDGKEIVVNNRFRFQQQDYFKKSLLSKAASGSEYVYFQSEEYLYMYNRIGDTGITLCGMIPKTSFMKQAWEIRFSTIILVVLACLVAVTIGVIIAGGIGRNMNRINQKLNQISEGDLTVTLTVSRRDEFGILANNITDMLNNMKNLILKMVHVSSLVSDSADDVLHVSRQITDSNFQITNAVYQIGHGISEQAGDSQNCLSEMDGLSGKIAAVNENLVEIERLMEDMKRLISRGLQTMEELTKQSDATNHITKYVVDSITVLEQKTKSIGEIIQVINEISDQTNLLSINASIEAARAGDAGKGFAVVASEIRNLASKAMNSAEEIRQMIDMITRQTNDTAAAAKEAENIVSIQNKVVDNTREAFRVMNSGIEKLINILAGIGQNIKNMEAAKEATLEAVESITAISGQTLASSGSIEKTVQEQACSMEVLVKEANILNDNARDLKEVVKMFRL